MGVHGCRPERVRRERAGGEHGEQVADCCSRERGGVPGGVQYSAQRESDTCADDGRRRAERWSERIARDEQLRGNGPGQRRSERRKYQAVEPDRDECADEDHGFRGRDRRGHRCHGDQQGPREVGPGQHPHSRPAVQEYPREGGDQAERQQQDGEPQRDPGGRRSTLRSEENHAHQPGLQQAVGELSDEPDPQQGAEGRRARRGHAGGGRSSR